MTWLKRLLGGLIIGLIRLYQYGISPLLGPRCRFWPSCSSYAVDALRLYGPFRGGWLALKRVAKCHPWHPGGIDPVPTCCDDLGNGTTHDPTHQPAGNRRSR